MRSSSTSSRRGGRAARLLVAAGLALLPTPALVRAADAGPDAAPVVVGFLPSRDEAVTRDLEDGARLGFDRAAEGGAPRVVLRRGETVGTWGTAGGSAARLVREGGAVALIAPPERDVSHLCVQVASKVLAPVVTTSRSPSVMGTGSPWVVRVVDPVGTDDPALVAPPFDASAPAARGFVTAFLARYGRLPGAWAVAGHDAARTISAGLVATGGRGEGDLAKALRALRGVPGATGSFDVDARGRRLPTCRGLLRALARPAGTLVGGIASAIVVRWGC